MPVSSLNRSAGKRKFRHLPPDAKEAFTLYTMMIVGGIMVTLSAISGILYALGNHYLN